MSEELTSPANGVLPTPAGPATYRSLFDRDLCLLQQVTYRGQPVDLELFVTWDTSYCDGTVRWRSIDSRLTCREQELLQPQRLLPSKKELTEYAKGHRFTVAGLRQLARDLRSAWATSPISLAIVYAWHRQRAVTELKHVLGEAEVMLAYYQRRKDKVVPIFSPVATAENPIRALTAAFDAWGALRNMYEVSPHGNRDAMPQV